MIHQQPNQENSKNKDIKTFNVIPTLLAMGQSANATCDIQRHIIRALDNICSNGSKVSRETTFEFISPFINQIISTTKDNEISKRAKVLLEKSNTFSQSSSLSSINNESDEKKSITDKNEKNDLTNDINNNNNNINNNKEHDDDHDYNDNEEDDDIDDITEVENQQLQENGSKGKSKKKNKKKKKNN